jgi:hypothetical protein
VDIVEVLHRFVGYAIPTAFGILALWAFGALAFKKEVHHDGFYGLLGVVQGAIVIQFLVGATLFISGERPIGDPQFLHYVYGAFFPALILLIAHMRARKAPEAPWLWFGIAAFICCFSTIRALGTGLGWF